MIDTLKLNILDCKIDPKTPLVIEPSPYLHDSQQKFINYDLFIDTAGECVQGKKAYLNSNKFNVTIKPKYELQHEAKSHRTITGKYIDGLKTHEIRTVDLPEDNSNAGIFVQTSLPRYLNTNNYQSISASDEKKVLNALEKDLWKAGIATNIWDSTLSRVDIFSNLNLDSNFKNYSMVFESLKLSRMEKFEYDGTTYLYKNGEQQICIYDKIEEMKDKIKNFKMSRSIPSNVMRIENRLLKKRKIRSASGFVQLRSLYKNYGFVKDHYKKEIGEKLFKYDPGELIDIANKNFIETINLFKNTKGVSYLSYMLALKGMASYLKSYSIGALIDMVDEIEPDNKLKRSRMKKVLWNYYRDLLMSGKIEGAKRTNLELYEELKTKFYKEVA